MQLCRLLYDASAARIRMSRSLRAVLTRRLHYFSAQNPCRMSSGVFGYGINVTHSHSYDSVTHTQNAVEQSWTPEGSYNPTKPIALKPEFLHRSPLMRNNPGRYLHCNPKRTLKFFLQVVYRKQPLLFCDIRLWVGFPSYSLPRFLARGSPGP